MNNLSNACKRYNKEYDSGSDSDSDSTSNSDIVSSVSSVSSSTPTRIGIETIALNTYLAAICDIIKMNTAKNNNSNGYNYNNNNSNNNNNNNTSNNHDIDDLIQEAMELLQPKIASQRYSIHDGPDTISFNIVLHTVASFSSSSSSASSSSSSSSSLLVHQIIKLMKESNIQPDIYTFNYRLQSCGNGIDGTNEKIQIMDEILALNQNYIMKNGNDNDYYQNDNDDYHQNDYTDARMVRRVRPDKYTIEAVLVPLAREGRIGDILELLKDFHIMCHMQQQQQQQHQQQQSQQRQDGTRDKNGVYVYRNDDSIVSSISDAYSTFLIALIKGGEMDIARSIFDSFILSSSTTVPASTANNYQTTLIFDFDTQQVQPITRHFNVLIEGYRHLSDKEMTSTKANKATTPAMTTPITETMTMTTAQSKKNSATSSSTTTSIKGTAGASTSSTSTSTPTLNSSLHHATKLLQIMIDNNVQPDAYTITSLMGLQNNSNSITHLWKRSISEFQIHTSIPIYHSIITAYGRIHDPSSACFVFHLMLQKNIIALNTWNVLLSALAKSMRHKVDPELSTIHCLQSVAATVTATVTASATAASTTAASNHTDRIEEDIIMSHEDFTLPGKTSFIDIVDNKSPFEAAKAILDIMKKSNNDRNGNRNDDNNIDDKKLKHLILKPNAQSYCLIASILSHTNHADPQTAMELYNDAIESNIPADGRFLNAIIRSFGNDIDSAILKWKNILRPAVIAYENRERSKYSTHKQGKNLIAAYHGLMHVAGKAGRPDIALRLVYAMNKEGLQPTESSLNCFQTGARSSKVDKSNFLNNQYVNLLTIECTKYNSQDKRRMSEKRVRIII